MSENENSKYMSQILSRMKRDKSIPDGQQKIINTAKTISKSTNKNVITIASTENCKITSCHCCDKKHNYKNINISKENGPQSETSIAVNPNNPCSIVAVSNDLVDDSIRAYYSSDGGKVWQSVKLPIPPNIEALAVQAVDPSVAWDDCNRVFVSYAIYIIDASANIVANNIAVARSYDNGKTWDATFSEWIILNNVFHNKAYITVDKNKKSKFYNRIYVAWARLTIGKDFIGDIVVAYSNDNGKTLSRPVVAHPDHHDLGLAPHPAVSPHGKLSVAWHDIFGNKILISHSKNGGKTFGTVNTISSTLVNYTLPIPAMNIRNALVYPVISYDPCDHCTVYCCWADSDPSGVFMKLYFSKSTDGGDAWSNKINVNDSTNNDQFNQWMSVDPISGKIVITCYDTRCDSTRQKTNLFYTVSHNKGLCFCPFKKITNEQSDETTETADPNQYGDYSGVDVYNNIAYPCWTDSRESNGPLLAEEIFFSKFEI